MCDKYRNIKKKIHKAKSKHKMCLDKSQFDTKEQAYQKGMTAYKCKYCGKYHRTSEIKRLLSYLKH
jgi:aspartate carbamoyltransferase regulatory subunit